MSKEIEAAVESLVAAAGVSFSALYCGEVKGALGDSPAAMDKWSCAFTKGDGREAHEEFEFYTGLGLRETVTQRDKVAASYGFPGLTAGDLAGRTGYGRRYLNAVEKKRKPRAPHVASVLYSLILDSSAGEQSFEDWCSDFGANTDSRKALETYLACQANASKLRRVFTLEELGHLRDALDGY